MKRLLFLLLLVSQIAYGQKVTTYGGKALTYGGKVVTVTPSTYCDEYQAVYDAYTTKPSDAVAAIWNTCVETWVANGEWATKDVIYVYAAHTNDNGEALLDWKQPAGGSRLNVSSCENSVGSPYDSFVAVGTDGFNAIADGISGNEICGTADELVVVSGKSYLVSFDLTINSGSGPTSGRFADAFGGGTRSNTITPVAGSNNHLLLCSGSSTVVFQLWQLNIAGNFELRNLRIKEWTNATAYNAPTFTAYEGFLGNGTTQYIDCNWNPSINGVNYTQNSASQIVYVRTDVAHLNTRYGVSGSADGKNIFIMPRRSESPTKAAIETNDNTQIYTADAVSGDGMLINTRTAAAVNKLYRNKVTIINATTTSTGIPTFSPYCLAGNDDGVATNFRPDQVSLYAFGAGLTQTDVNNITDRFETRMDALGKGIIAYVDPITDPLGDLLKLQYLALQLRIKQHENAFFNPAP